MRVDVGGADQLLEMASQRADRLGRIEHQIHVADIDCRARLAEDRVGHGIAQAPVIEKQPERRIEVVEQVGHVAQLRLAMAIGEAGPYAEPTREDLKRVARHADLHVGLGAPVVVDAVLGLAGLRLAALVGDVGFVVDQCLGAQQVGNARWHVADLRAGSFRMPFGNERALEAARRLLDLQAFADFAGHAFVLADAEQPVERHLVDRDDGQQRLGARQARGGA